MRYQTTGRLRPVPRFDLLSEYWRGFFCWCDGGNARRGPETMAQIVTNRADAHGLLPVSYRPGDQRLRVQSNSATVDPLSVELNAQQRYLDQLLRGTISTNAVFWQLPWYPPRRHWQSESLTLTYGRSACTLRPMSLKQAVIFIIDIGTAVRYPPSGNMPSD